MAELGLKNPIIYGLPRGGISVSAPIARYLKAPLGVAIARKIGHPANKDYAIGAVTEMGGALWNEAEKNLLGPIWAEKAVQSAKTECATLRQIYGRALKHEAKGRVIVLVDDGVATGLTLLAAIDDLHQLKPARLIVAVPAVPKDLQADFQAKKAEIISLIAPEDYSGEIEIYYRDFMPISDEEVIRTLQELT